tara:strand:+ start:256 stop:1542 length:1287 start_codon:yes stop_codon:yes gene_type:complete
MEFWKLFSSKDNIQLDKKTLVMLRWIANGGQLITINFVYFILNYNLPFFFCSFIILLGILSNIFLQFKVKKKVLNNFSATSYLFYDLVQLSLLIFLTGGITNPFVILLAIPAVVSSTFLSIKSTFNLSLITFASLVLLTIYHFPLPNPGDLHFHVPKYYLYGVPSSIIIGLIFLTYFGARFGAESRKRSEALSKLELVLAKEHELKTIGVQAAAAAHSLSTPLSTIRVVAKELEKELSHEKKYLKDIKLLLSQSLRCGEILQKLSMTPLKRDDFFENVKLKDLLMEIADSFKEISEKNFVVKLNDNKNDPTVKRKAELTYGLRNFVGNASKFSNTLVEIVLESDSNTTTIKVCDDGPGFSDDIINFLGEPYIHSKNAEIDSKSGLGLGTFIGKTLLERMKADVEFGRSSNTNGAMVTIKWSTKNLLSI